ncbi:hypothetical protein E5675_16190 [Sphingopyxis sp. PAMC25046]|nr:hypothetical protein E5675_16190 [Sphingopyxis sp. PAMC25046]
MRSIHIGLRATVTLRHDDAAPELSTMQLALEPDTGGDHSLTTNGATIIEQVKMRRSSRGWSPGEIAKKVFPDLLKAVKPGTEQSFRFVTDKEQGLASLRGFLDAWQSAPDPAVKPPRLAWGRERLTPEAFAARLATSAEVDPADPAFRALLAGLSIEVVDTSDAVADVERLLAPLLEPGQDAETKRHEMTSRLLGAAEDGRTLDAADLLALIAPQAMKRLGHAQALPALLAASVRSDCANIGYDASRDARPVPVIPSAALTLLSAESGQGKTWALCRSAIANSEAGRLSVVVASPQSIEQIVEHLNARVWRVAYGQNTAPDVMAQRLAGALQNDGYWLNLYIDDVQSRDLAGAIARLDWGAHGIRIIVSAQPRVTEVFEQQRSDCDIVPIENFNSAQLRRFLERHDRAAPLETMPDDVLELLMKPIHARVFVQLPQSDGWTGVTEYQLFKAYWTFSTTDARNQRDHRSDGDRLAELAGSLLGDNPRYPWPRRDAEAVGLDDAALARLELVGLIRWDDGNALVFTSDRMLNWAVAEYLAVRIVDQRWGAERIADILDRIEAHAGALARLGYVFLDLLWLLAKATSPEKIADVLLLRAQRLPHEWRGAAMWNNIATVGPDVLPALENLATRVYDEDRDWDIPRNIPVALAAIAESDHKAVAGVVGRLLASEAPHARRVAFRTARAHPFPELLDALWTQYLERNEEFERHLASGAEDDNFNSRSARDIAWTAAKLAAASHDRWLDARIAASDDPGELDQLLWVLTDRSGLKDERADAIWHRHRDKFLRVLPQHSKALVNALGHFRDIEGREWLDAVPLSRDDWMSSRVLRSLARVDPDKALRLVAARDEDYRWSSSNWWLPELAFTHPDEVAAAIMESAQGADDPLTDVVLYYRSHLDLIDEATLEWILDRFADALAALSASDSDAEERLGSLRHSLTFLAELVLPWQFECLARRAGTALEEELVRLATSRTGRTSRLRDTEGNACERLLAAIGGEGYDLLVRGELGRPDGFGREDGYAAAQWTEASEVRDALDASSEADPDGYRAILRMQALAVHERDAKIEDMVRSGAPIYVNAADIRGSVGRNCDTLLARVHALLATGDETDAEVAAKLAGFLADGTDLAMLIELFTASGTSNRVRRSILGTLRAHEFYDASILPVAGAMLEGDLSDEGQFLAVYLSEYGDGHARALVMQWLEGQDLGTWFQSRDLCLMALLDHEDSRPAVIEFLLRSRRNGHIHLDMRYLTVLADAGDSDAQARILSGAYRDANVSFRGTGDAIRHLAKSDPDEAFFAAKRYLARQGAIDAIRLMLELDRQQALPLLIAKFRSGKPSVKASIARQMRFHVPMAELKTLVDTFARGNGVRDRILAAELASWMPPSLDFPWLADFARAQNRELHDIALEAIARRQREAGAAVHVEAFDRSSKPQKRARLDAVFHSVDPHLLWSKDDPASLEALLDRVPQEFVVEARDLYARRSKKVAEDEKKADKDD